jgi:hypothetical protein
MPQVVVNYMPAREGAKSKITFANTTGEASANEVKIVVGASVSLRRQTEICAAIDMLANGIRDRKLLEAQFNGVGLATVVSIDEITSANRRTSATLTGSSFAATDVGICIGTTASIQHRVALDTAIQNLKSRLLEELKDQAAA